MKRIQVRVLKEDIDHGTAKSGMSCPIARALQRKFPASEIHVGGFGAVVGKMFSVDPEPRNFRMSKRGTAFVMAFDMGWPVEPTILYLTEKQGAYHS